MIALGSAVQSFLLALSALFSIVNPLATALIYSQVTGHRPQAERRILAAKVAIYASIVMLVALWGGAYVLSFFGVTLSALRIAGGLVVAVSAWDLLSQPEASEERKHEQARYAGGPAEDVAFFPLTLPFTTGPGTISVAVALGSDTPQEAGRALPYVLGASAAACCVALMVWVAYRSADVIVAWLGAARARILGRLSAFLLLCVGTQITMSGLSEFLHHVFRAH